MNTLKDLRIKKGLSQTQLANAVKVQQGLISAYESGVSLPDLETMISLESELGGKVAWEEKLNPKQKFDTVQAIIDLCQRYPTQAAVDFAARAFRREKSAVALITFYASVALGNEREPLPPTGVTFKTKKL
jgi:transcriptional regulator with XRE-family HTH domain